MATQQKERNGFGPTTSVGEAARDTANKAGDAAKDAANKAGDTARDTAYNTGDAIRGAAEKAGDLAKDTANKAGELAKDVANRAGDFVKDTASTVAEKTSDAACYVAHKADDATSAVGSNIKAFAGTIRDSKPQSGILGAAEAAVADTLETCGAEIEQGIGGMADDLTNTIRKYPIPSVLIGVGVGFLVARTLTK